MSRYNFTRPEIRSGAGYKLWVLYKPGAQVKSMQGQVKVYYSYDSRSGGKYALSRLRQLVFRNFKLIEKAIIYDKTTNQEIDRFPKK